MIVKSCYLTPVSVFGGYCVRRELAVVSGSSDRGAPGGTALRHGHCALRDLGLQPSFRYRGARATAGWLSLSLAIGCAAKPGPSSSAAPTPVASRAAPASAPASSARQDLDAFVAEIVAAAHNRDFSALESLMDPSFETDMMAPTTVGATLSQWREDSGYLDQVVQLLEGRCAFVDTNDHLLCPGSLMGLEAWGDATRIHLVRREGRWNWTAFVMGDPSVSFEASDNAMPPSKSPVHRTESAPGHADPDRGAGDQDFIRRVVRAHLGEVRDCYNQELVEHPTVSGRVTMQFTIGPDGSVPAAVVANSDVPARVGECIAVAIRGWKFPRPQGGGNAVVTYPFLLTPG